jgi:hypothetical protein
MSFCGFASGMYWFDVFHSAFRRWDGTPLDRRYSICPRDHPSELARLKAEPRYTPASMIEEPIGRATRDQIAAPLHRSLLRLPCFRAVMLGPQLVDQISRCAVGKTTVDSERRAVFVPCMERA